METNNDKKVQTVELFFDGQKQLCEVERGSNGDYVCTVVEGPSEGRFIKFPEGDLKKHVTAHNVNNAPSDEE